MLATGDAVTTPALYAFTLGLVAAVNPCGFPLLPAYLTLLVGEPGEGGWTQQTGRALGAGAAVTGGFVLVFGALGIAVESGVHVLMGWLPWAMIPLGSLLVLLGVLTLVGRGWYPRLPTVSLAGRRGFAGLFLFGVAYAVASLSCALPLFLAGVAGSFTHRGAGVGITTVVAYALGMGLFLMVASLAVALAGSSSLRQLRSLTRFVPRIGGAVLTVVGAYLVYYWANDLADPLHTPGPVRLVENVQSSISNWLASSPRIVGVVLGAVVVLTLAATALAHRRGGDPGGHRRDVAGGALEAGDAGRAPAGATPSGAPR